MNRALLSAALFALCALPASAQQVLRPGTIFPSHSVLENTGAFGGLKVTTEEPAINLQFQYNVNTEKVSTTTANGGTVTQANSEALLQTSAAANGSATMSSRYAIRYVPGQGIIIRFTARFASGCVANSQQEAGLGNLTDGLMFGCVGAQFGIIHRRDSVDTFIPTSAWATNAVWDPTKGNVFTINYQWLGYGVIKFFMETREGETVEVYRIKYSNANTQVSLTNPTMGFRSRVVNTGNASNLTLAIPSVGMYREGGPANWSVHGAAQNRKTAIGATLTNILTIRNNTTFVAKPNTTNVRLDHFAVACSSDCSLRVIRGATLGGAPSFTDFDSTTSVVAVDTAGTTVTGGRYITGTVTDTGDDSIQLDRVELRIGPGETLTFAAASVTGNANIAVHASWSEEF